MKWKCRISNVLYLNLDSQWLEFLKSTYLKKIDTTWQRRDKVGETRPAFVKDLLGDTCNCFVFWATQQICEVHIILTAHASELVLSNFLQDRTASSQAQ